MKDFSIILNIAIDLTKGEATVTQDPAKPTIESQPKENFLDKTDLLSRADMGMGYIVNGKYFAKTPEGLKEAKRELLRKTMVDYYSHPVIELARQLKK